MASKLVTDREKSADSVVAVETHAAAVAEALAPTLKRHLKKGETLPDVALLVRLLCAELDAAKTRMVAADEAHQAGRYAMLDGPFWRATRSGFFLGVTHEGYNSSARCASTGSIQDSMQSSQNFLHHVARQTKLDGHGCVQTKL